MGDSERVSVLRQSKWESGYFVEALSEVRRAFDGNRTGGIGVGRWMEEKEGTLFWSLAKPATHEQTADQALETGVC